MTRWLALGIAVAVVAAALALTLARGLRRPRLEYRQQAGRCCATYGGRELTCWQGPCSLRRE